MVENRLCSKCNGGSAAGATEGGAHGAGAFLVAVIIAAEDVGEEKELQHTEDDYQLYYDDGPKGAAYGHRPEAVDIEVDDASPKGHGKSDEVVGYDGEDVGRIIYNVIGMIVAELAHGAETPGHAHRLDAGATRRLHIHARVADIEGLGLGSGMNREYVEHYRRVGLRRHTLLMAESSDPFDIGKEYAHKLGHRFLILVGGDGHSHTALPKLGKQVGYAGIDPCAVGKMLSVVVVEHIAYPLKGRLGAVLLGESPLKQTAHSVAHHHGIGFKGMRRKPLHLQGMVGSGAEVVDGVEQSAVEVKDYKLFHQRKYRHFPPHFTLFGA